MEKSTDTLKTKTNLTKYTTASFIEKAKEVHGEKFDYSKTVYVNCH